MQTSVTKKTPLLTILLLVTGSACAEWERVASGVDGQTYYVDQTTIRKDGNLRKVWELQEFTRRKEDGEISRRVRNEYDCKDERRRLLAVTSHSAPMAGGKTIFSYDGIPQQEWEAIPPRTLGEKILNIVCAK